MVYVKGFGETLSQTLQTALANGKRMKVIKLACAFFLQKYIMQSLMQTRIIEWIVFNDDLLYTHVGNAYFI